MGYWIAAIVIVLLIATEIIISGNRLKTVVYELKYENLPAAFDGYAIIQLSDLHGKRFGAHNERLLRAIQKIPADAMMMTGDMIDKFQSNHASLIRLVSKLKELAPIYYICGNHELYLGDEAWGTLKSDLIQAGVHVLDNEKTALEKDGASIDCYGLCVPLYNYHGMNRYYEGDTTFGTAEIRGIFGVLRSDRFTVLLAHRPILFEDYAAWGADLTLSGMCTGA
jgi:predicted MPP superfamily phosphohydrolase